MIKLPYRIVTVLNEFQVETVKEWLSTCMYPEKFALELEQNIKDMTDDDAREFLIDNIVIPHNRSKLNEKTSKLIDEGRHTVICVSGDDEEPPFSYSVGATLSVGFEVFCSGVNPTTMGNIINDIIDQFKGGVSLADIGEELIKLSSGVVGRVQLKRMQLTPTMVNDYLKAVDNHLNQSQFQDVVVLILPDGNNILPGEEGYDKTFKQITLGE